MVTEIQFSPDSIRFNSCLNSSHISRLSLYSYYYNLVFSNEERANVQFFVGAVTLI